MKDNKSSANWIHHYLTIQNYMETYKRRPSKHRVEDHKMLNWIKYNKRKLIAGQMPEERQKLFKGLLETADNYLKINQYTYAPTSKQGMTRVVEVEVPQKNKRGRKKKVQ